MISNLLHHKVLEKEWQMADDFVDILFELNWQPLEDPWAILEHGLSLLKAIKEELLLGHDPLVLINDLRLVSNRILADLDMIWHNLILERLHLGNDVRSLIPTASAPRCRLA
jgi:hypothetical protein